MSWIQLSSNTSDGGSSCNTTTNDDTQSKHWSD